MADVKPDSLFQSISHMISELEDVDSEAAARLRARLAQVEADACHQLLDEESKASGDTNVSHEQVAEIAAASQLDGLEQRLRKFETRIEDADPKVQALVQAALQNATTEDGAK
mmetsp:Transcript_23846/g.45323  ORF Transcript_23846/g.45323 Transcript_23846/m.45323 type:complete len:113 (-) Transcript_23846:344-682(-)